MIAHRTASSGIIFRFKIILLVFAAALTACESMTKTTVGSKSAANEAVALGALRTISSSEATYMSTHDGNYGTFAELVRDGLLDARFSGAQPVVGGYVLTMNVLPLNSASNQPATFTVNADPQQDVAAGLTGNRHFYLDSSGVIHVNAKQAAAIGDPPLQ